MCLPNDTPENIKYIMKPRADTQVCPYGGSTQYDIIRENIIKVEPLRHIQKLLIINC